MWFKNLCLYRLRSPWTLSAADFEEVLRTSPLNPVSGLSWTSEGWVSPRGDAQLVFAQEKQLLFAMGAEKKLLPSTVIRDVTAERARTFEQVKGFAPSRKQVRDLKEQVTNELLPRAFGQRRVTRAWLDTQTGWLVIDAGSLTLAESLVELLRKTLETLTVEMPDCDPGPGTQMTQWLAGGSVPDPFDLDDECELVGVDLGRPAVRYARHALDLPEIRGHISDGKSVTRLKLRWHDRISFLLDSQMVLKRISLDDMDEDGGESESDADAAFAADFTLMAAELGALLKDLRRVMEIAD
jgi:recombination associated protein RdgC